MVRQTEIVMLLFESLIGFFLPDLFIRNCQPATARVLDFIELFHIWLDIQDGRAVYQVRTRNLDEVVPNR